jgi:hypothetical protein
MIADHHSDFSFEFPGLLALQKIFEAMRQARGEQCDLGDVVAEMDLKLHAEFLGKRAQAVGYRAGGNLESVQAKFEAGEEDAGFHIGVLVRLEDVASVVKNKAGNSRDETFLIGTGDEQRGGFRHGQGCGT